MGGVFKVSDHTRGGKDWGLAKIPTPPQTTRQGGVARLERRVEVEDVADLEVDAVIQHEIAAYERMDVVGRRRRQHRLQFVRARPDSAAQARRQRAADDQLPLKSRRQAVALGQSRGQVRVMRPIPLVDIAVMIAISLVTVSAIMIVVMAVSTVIVGIVAVMLVVAVIVILRHG